MIDRLIEVHISSIVNEVIRTILSLFIFLQKNLERTKMQIEIKPTSKTKKATIFCAQKLLGGRKLFLKKMEIVLITSFTILLKIAYNHPQPPIVTHIHSCFDLNTICEMCVILLLFNTYLLWWILMYPSIFVPLYLPLMRCKKQYGNIHFDAWV